MSLTEAQKAAQSRYYKSSQPIQYKVVYKTEDDKIEGRRLKQYLAETGQSANSYIKALIKADLDAKGISYPAQRDAGHDAGSAQ